mmetsp:Transcript_54349/g.80611  ORF Transcript_54349/g.80611 Transcript_54349/m.80611 type:complete len:114 (-) Transcript_54349:453-794(-)
MGRAPKYGWLKGTAACIGPNDTVVTTGRGIGVSFRSFDPVDESEEDLDRFDGMDGGVTGALGGDGTCRRRRFCDSRVGVLLGDVSLSPSEDEDVGDEQVLFCFRKYFWAWVRT